VSVQVVDVVVVVAFVIVQAKSAPEQSSSMLFPQTSVAPGLIAALASLQSPVVVM